MPRRISVGVMSETFESTADHSGNGEAPGVTPLESFILDQVEPQREKLNTWDSARSHLQLLVHTAHGQKLKPKQIGGKKSDAFTLTRSGKQTEGFQDNVTTLVSDQALRAASSRELIRQCMALSDIPHLKGRTFHVSQSKSAADFHRDAGQPLSIKPVSDQV